MITIGAIYRGPELRCSPLALTVARASVLTRELREPTYDNGITPWVNAVFVVPGSLGKPEFRGLVYGAYTKARKGVVVQIAVSENDAKAGLAHVVIDGLHGANAMAFEFFRKKRESFPLAEAEQLVGKLKHRLGN